MDPFLSQNCILQEIKEWNFLPIWIAMALKGTMKNTVVCRHLQRQNIDKDFEKILIEKAYNEMARVDRPRFGENSLPLPTEECSFCTACMALWRINCCKFSYLMTQHSLVSRRCETWLYSWQRLWATDMKRILCSDWLPERLRREKGSTCPLRTALFYPAQEKSAWSGFLNLLAVKWPKNVILRRKSWQILTVNRTKN